MKTGIHPTYFAQAKVTCACGNSFMVGSTMEEIHVEICSHCHPFYTGKQKLVDTAKRVEKFQARAEKKSGLKTGGKKAKRAKAQAKKVSKKASISVKQ